MNAVAFQHHLQADTSPFVLGRKASGPTWGDEEIHRLAFEDDPELYALRAIAANVQHGQRVRALYQILRSSSTASPATVRHMLDRVADVLSAIVPADDMLTVFLALRRERITGKHARRFVLRYILNHPCLEDLVQHRRPAIVDCIEHAIGRNVARGCARRLKEVGGEDAYFNRNLLRFADNKERAAAVFGFLYGQSTLPVAVKQESYAVYHKQLGPVERKEQERPKTVTATNRGDIAATLVHLYRGGDSGELLQALDTYADRIAAEAPEFGGSVSLVLDVSASTRGYGDREFCCVSQSVALRLALQRCCKELNVHQVGGVGNPPLPEGSTDLAEALLDALSDAPDIVAIVSDGYENVHAGDLQRVVASLPTVGIDIPIVFCHSKFTDKDSLECRRPMPAIPELAFWHEQDFDNVLYSLFSMASGDAGKRFIRKHMATELKRREMEVNTWTRIK
jgi:hypothetical protein